ncbi:PKD domain-containing protein [Baekduia sp. Peel2402]|uniref:PKD domain-containing protein n=1 Tax=Baekduia sp. Peel2402 TaxID=3458296 RepID=UPI00403E890E
MGRRISLAAACAVAVLSVPASVVAATRVVDAQAGPYTTITDALLAAAPGDTIDIHQGHYHEDLWVDKDDITLHGAPGTIVSETGPHVVALMGARATIDNLMIAGGPGGVRIEGDGARLLDSTILADTNSVAIKDALDTRLDRVLVRATALAGTALTVTHDTPDFLRTVVSTSIVVGGREGRGIALSDGAVGDVTPTGGQSLAAIQSTISGAPTSVFTTTAGQGHSPDFDNYNSLVDGGDRTAGFVNAAALDFHMRETAVQAGGLQLPAHLAQYAPRADYDGVPLPTSGNVTPGAFQFTDRAPNAILTASATTVRQGATVRFDASGSIDPDVGGRIDRYIFEYGDGTVFQPLTWPTVDHVFARPGRYLVTVRALDSLGAGTTSAPVAITVTDAVAPVLGITTPREKAKHKQLRRSGRKRVVNVLKVAGRVTDDGGVARVDVTLARGKVTHTGRATLGKGATFTWHSPAKAKLARGTWTLTVRATDRAGNASQAVMHFTVT